MSVIWVQENEALVLKLHNRLSKADGGGMTDILRVDPTSGKITFSKEIALPEGVSVSLAAGDVTTAELATGAVTTAKVAAAAITTAKVAPAAITTAELATGAVTTAELATGAVTKAKALVFCSTEQTGDGLVQSIAHGLAATPSLVLVSATAGHDGASAPGDKLPTLTEGTHTSTNVLVTCDAGAKYKVMAWA